jgi:hypothetical protein
MSPGWCNPAKLTLEEIMAPVKPLDNLVDMATALTLLEGGAEEDWLVVLRYSCEELAKLVYSGSVPIYGQNNVYHLCRDRGDILVSLCLSLEEGPSPETVETVLGLGLLLC